MELNQDLIDAIGKRIEWYKNLRPEQKLLGDRGFAGSIAQDDLAKLYDLIQLVIQERDDLQAELASLREIARTLKDAAWRGDDQLWPIVPNRIENLISDHESKWGKVEKEGQG